MGVLLNSIRGAMGRSADGQKDQTDAAANDANRSKRLQFVTDKWTDLKNAYIVYHQSIWQSLLFYANQSR